MKKQLTRAISLLLSLVLMLGMIPAGVAAPVEASAASAEAELTDGSIRVDFMDFAQQAAQQSWWSALKDTNMSGVKVLGIRNASTIQTEAELQALAQMRDWMAQTVNWSIDVERTNLNSVGHLKRLFINADASRGFALRLYPAYLSDAVYTTWYFNVEVPEGGAGAYAMLLDHLLDRATYTIDNTGAGGYMNVYVNDALVYEGLHTRAEEPKPVVQNMGIVELHEGTNTVAFRVTADCNGNAVNSDRSVNLRGIEFKKLDTVEVQAYINETIDLNTTYLPFDHAVSSETHTAVSSNDIVLSASIDANGDLVLSGKVPGEVEVDILRGDEVVAAVDVIVREFTGELDDLGANTVTIDLAASLTRAVDEPWWETFADGEESGTKVLDGTEEDYEALRDWLDASGAWNLAEVPAAAVTLGVSGAASEELELSVLAPASGLYALRVQGSFDGADVTVNDTAVYAGLTDAGKFDLGAVYFEKGLNTLAFCGDTALRSIVLTPLGSRQAELDSTLYVDLLQTYLPFDTDLETAELGAVSDDPVVASAHVDEEGYLIVGGRQLGSATITVTMQGEAAFRFTVHVIEPGVFRNLFYTLDEFKAATLAVGEVAEGVVSGLTTEGTPLAEKQLRHDGSVYFSSSDISVATVDQATGDVTCVGEGTAKISAYAVFGGVTQRADAVLCVTDDTDLAAIGLYAVADYVGVDNTLQIKAEGVKSSGVKADMSLYPLSWTVDDSSIAKVDDMGRLTGLKPGTVTVTATAGVMRMAIVGSMEVEIVENALLDVDAQLYDFTYSRVLDVKTATLETDGYEVDWERTVKNGADMRCTGNNGIDLKVNAGEALYMNFMIKKSGWYRLEVRGRTYVGRGAHVDVFVDDASYMGMIDFEGIRSENYNGGGFLNTVWLDAGVHSVSMVSQDNSRYIQLGKVNFYPTEDPRVVDVALSADKTELIIGETTETQVVLTDANGAPFYLKRVAKIPAYTNYYMLESTDPDVVSISGSTLTGKEGKLEGTIEVDFIDAALQASSQSWWSALRDTDTKNVKIYGRSGYSDTVTAEETAAYRQMLQWLSDTYGWTINEKRSMVEHEGLMKRLFINCDPEQGYGMRFYPTFLSDNLQQTALYLTVNAETSGLYDMSFAYLQDTKIYTNGRGSGATFDLYVNDQLIKSNVNTWGETKRIELELGTVSLSKGENTVTLVVHSDKVGGTTNGDRTLNLCAMTFTPKNGITVNVAEAMAEASGQDFWADLRNTDTTDVKMAGSDGTYATETEFAAYLDMVQWLKDTYGWTIDEEKTLVENTYYRKRLFVNGDPERLFGMFFYPTLLDSNPKVSGLYLTVDVAEAGLYDMVLDYVQSNSLYVNGRGPGGTVDIYVNDVLVKDDLNTWGATQLVSLELGQVQLHAGENTVLIHVHSDKSGKTTNADRSFLLTNMSFVPIGAEGAKGTGGTAKVKAVCEILREPAADELTVTVKPGLVTSVELSADSTTVRPDAEDFSVYAAVNGLEGTIGELPEGVQTILESGDTSIATVTQEGLVHLTGKEGSVELRLTVTEGERTVTAKLWITVTSGKTAPTLYTEEERANAQENVKKYTWAWEEMNSAVKLADYYLEHFDQIYYMITQEGLPRNSGVARPLDTYSRAHCPYCDTDLQSIYSHQPWVINTIENPWKITCPICDRDFPSNDFESFYKCGIDEQGRFSVERAMANGGEQYLVNELYPEMGEGWGVDDGFGYKPGEFADNGTEVVWTFIAHYVAAVMYGLGEYDQHSILEILDAIGHAYLYTGDEKYGSAGAILIDRIADVYPDFLTSNYPIYDYGESDGYSGRGKIMGIIWEPIIGNCFARAVDTFWPAMDNPDVIEYLRNNAVYKGMDAEAITPEQVRDHTEQNILIEIYEGAKANLYNGNFGMHQSAVGYAAAAYGKEPLRTEMLEWIFNKEEQRTVNGVSSNAGGDVMYMLIDEVSRDGFGNEGSLSYNSLWPIYMLDVADALEGIEGFDLWENSKFIGLFTGGIRMTTLGDKSPNLHETSGAFQNISSTANLERMLTAFVKTGDRVLARAIYARNGNKVDGLHGDIFTKDPEYGIRSQIQQIVLEDGEWDMSQSSMLPGYGIAILREGPQRYLGKNVNGDQFSDYWMYFGYTNSAHHQREVLGIGVEAFGLPLDGNMGYPRNVNASDPTRMQWIANTVSNNTVVVDDKPQMEMAEGGFPLHFDDAGAVKVMDAEAPNAYPEADVYRRTVVSVAAEDGQHYAVDFFRVLGGSEHVYSFHGATRIDPTVEGLDMTEQPMGTYAGADIPFGDHDISGTGDASTNMGSGYSWLYNVSRDETPEATFSIDWQIEDYQHQLVTSNGIHMRLTMLSEEPMTEVALADGQPAQDGRAPDHVEYVLIRRSGDEGMDTLFTAVIEPYKGTAQILRSELVETSLVEGVETPTDKIAVIKNTLVGGRVDYVIYATNPNCTYEIDGLFRFRGAIGVCSYKGGQQVYAYGNEAELVGDLVVDALPRVTGTVESFTEDLAQSYEMTVKLDTPIAAEELKDRWIYVENDGKENAAYQIFKAEIRGDTAVLDLQHQCLIRACADPADMSRGYVHNLTVGDRFTIPMSASSDIGAYFTHTTDQVVKAGSKQTLILGKAGSGAAYEIEGLPTTAKIDGKTGTVTWTPSRTQTGRYPVTVKAVCDGETVAEMSFVIYVVSYTGSAYDASVCKHAKAVTYEADGMLETVCPACGTVTKTAVEDAPEVTEKFKFVGSNMTLGNELKLNFMVDTADLKDGHTALITHKGETVEASFAKYNNTYSFVSQSVAAKEMADAIEVVVVDADGNEVSEVYTASVRDYAMKALTAASSSAEVKTMVVDMLNYGAAAQTYFEYNEADLAN
ncbi:MAG: Ig-like domain-containing protein, partial [Oscillospiraceae bacterium]|nr:Ig-like domain-containing protein [Oscillospiraceae bacterium]